ncbi:MAG: TRAP transporter TatT component family protein [Treponema sp.]|nr:TRAP transporter TatT component family protein [Treponema sp.]
MKTRYIVLFSLFSFLFPLLTGCSINTLVANALTGDGGSAVFTGDSDPALIGDALPFAIKMYEALLDSTPKHQGLRLVTGSLFIMYANAFVQGPAEMLHTVEWRQRDAELQRAKRLYLRGCDILYGALDLKYRGFSEATMREGTLQPLLKKCKKDDVGLLYWTVAGGLSAYAIDVLDFDLSVRIPEWAAMMQRAYELDPHYSGAALDEFFILFYASLPDTLGGDKERAKYHFQQALEKTGGNSASAYIAYAESICVPDDYESYKSYLEKALAIDPDADPSMRLVTIISQRKAQWLLDNAWKYFSFLPMPDDW